MKRTALLLSASAFLAGCPAMTGIPQSDVPQVGHQAARLFPGGPALESADSSDDTAIPSTYRALRSQRLSWEPRCISSFSDTLAPGAVVFWVPDSTLPLASVDIVWPEGRLALGPRDDAAASLLGAMLRRGGAGGLAAAKVDDTLEYLAAHASVSVGMVRTSASAGGLSRDLPFLLKLLGDMLCRPGFDTARLSTAVAERIQDIEHRADTPAQVLGLAWDRVAYGPSAWTRLSDSSDVRSLRRDDLRRARAGRFSPRKVWISVAGRYDKEATRGQLLSLLSDLRAASGGVPVARLDSVPQPPPLPPPGTWIFDIPANQAQIRMGTRFVRRDHPDYYPLVLASEVLGQGFGSRLVDRIRSDEGLAYHVGSWAGSDYDRPAMLGVGLQTKSGSVGRAVRLVREEIARLRDSGFREGELRRVRESIRNGVPSMFDSPEATADMILQSAAWGRRDDHFAHFMRAIDTIPDSTVLSAFRRWFVPESLRTVVSGPADELRRPFADGSPSLSSWGPIHVWNLDSLSRN